MTDTNGKPIVWPKSSQFFLGAYLLKDFYAAKTINLLFSGSFPGHAAQLVKLSIFYQAVIIIVHQTRLTFDLEIDNP